MFSPSSESQKAKIDQIAERTYDISQFLINFIGIDLVKNEPEKKLKPVVTWHDPCHLRKTLGICSEPRQLIRANDAYSFVEMPAPDTCCGMGGSFNLAYYRLSADIGQKKVAGIAKTGADVVATGCPACMIQLSDLLASEGEIIRVAHPVELYAEKILLSDIHLR